MSSGGVEYFISFEDQLGYIYGFTRLFLPYEKDTIQIPWLGRFTAIIRELHIYGQMEWLKEEKIEKSKNDTHMPTSGCPSLDSIPVNIQIFMPWVSTGDASTQTSEDQLIHLNGLPRPCVNISQ